MKEKPKLKFDKLHWLFMSLTTIMIVLYYIESEDLMGDKPTTQELIQLGRDLEIMNMYSPVELKTAINNDEFDYDDLSNNMKELIDVVKLDKGEN